MVIQLLTFLQHPAIYEMGSHEKNFALKVEELLSSITFPEYRQMIVEVIHKIIQWLLEQISYSYRESACMYCAAFTSFVALHRSDCMGITVRAQLLMVVSTVLERNPEVIIKGSINLDEVRN